MSSIKTEKSDYLNLYALMLIKNSYFDRAIELSKKIISKEPDNYFALFHLGAAYRMKQQYDKSKHYLKHAIRVSYGNSILAYISLLDTCLFSEDVDCMDKYGKKLLSNFTLIRILDQLKELEKENLTTPIIQQSEIYLYLKKLSDEYYQKI
ncbi:hypothetical protein MTBBW1_900022 [Desulfamplus magnetovallimortis]|uniref:Uncharacterized protein n=1 Tax=Desulfamplus magnetovallimortis TaxID=1246637 RepID=A0A1W1HL49_9BACT|nr:hypothetical protein [Desulfamplus magnetovallimortis]SLM33155.1 hypothetical protein MTBBW1_900022 [Desulfamplus magnetovallimortis]